MLRIEKSHLAEQDLLNIWLYSFERWSLEHADRYLDEIELGLITLSSNAEIGIASDDIKHGYRRFHVNHHFIWYKIVSDEVVYIVRVLGEDMDYRTHIE
ncbi:MAG: type II toxin-antitoxin system RelE/ParE family toxin [Alphaproteobacteria bacterium]